MSGKFRAKSIETNKWVYGYYLYIEETNRHYILTGKLKSYPVDTVHDHLTVQGFEWTEVDGNTVCSIVIDLLNDGDTHEEIYEGDIVEITLTQIEDKLLFERNKIVGYIVYDYTIGIYYLKGNFMKFSEWMYNEYKVIGNVFDNKNMLERIYNVF